MNLMKQFFRDQRGNVLMITGLMVLILFAITGMGVDLGRQQLVKLRIQQATDAAALAAASLPDNPTDTDRYNAALRYFKLNFPATYLDVVRPAPSINIGSDVRVSASAEVPTIFIRYVGTVTATSSGNSVVGVTSSTTASDYDVVMVVDESGSMMGSDKSGATRISTVRNSLKDMIESIFPTGGTTNLNVRLGMVGYTGYISNIYGLTSDRTQALGYVNNLQARCQNYDHYGMAAGYNMVTGDWAGKTAVTPITCLISKNIGSPAAVTNRSDGEKLSKLKQVVFLTDGYIMVEPPACPQYPCYKDFLTECTKLKAAGVIVYTISFVSQTSGDEATLKTCASTDETGKPRYYYAPDGDTLKTVLKSVSSTIKKTRITE